MLLVRFNEVMRQHGVVNGQRYADVVLLQHEQIELHILPNFQMRLAFEQGFKMRENRQGFFAVGRTRHIPAFVRLGRKGKSHQLCIEIIERRSFGVEAKLFLLLQNGRQ